MADKSLNPYVTPQIYWCHVCDANKVHSNKPETGKFYHVFGHAFDDGNYHSIFFAICPDCNVLDALNVVQIHPKQVK